MKFFISIAVLITLSLPILAGQAPPKKKPLSLSTEDVVTTSSSWSEQSFTDGGFTILLPGSPTRQRKSINTPLGGMEIELLTSEHNGVGYIVGHCDIPAAVVDPRAQEEFLNGVREGVIRQTKGKLISESPVTISGYPGKEFNIQMSGGSFMSRVFLVNQRMYQIMYGMPDNVVDRTEPNRFLESFRLIQ